MVLHAFVLGKFFVPVSHKFCLRTFEGIAALCGRSLRKLFHFSLTLPFVKGLLLEVIHCFRKIGTLGIDSLPQMPNRLDPLVEVGSSYFS